jgi:hypothetical protein
MEFVIERDLKETSAVEDVGVKERLSRLAKKAKRLNGEGKKLPRGFQLEPKNPETVGMNEEASDAFSPEELVELFAHPRKIVDWDRLEKKKINYFWKGE